MLEVLPIGKFYEKFFIFTETDPINLNFESIGFESRNFLKNIGLMILPLGFLIIQLVIVICLYLIKPCRKKRIYRKLKGNLLYKFPISFLID